MAQLARLRWEVYHRGTFKPVYNASVEVRSQGAQVLGNQAGPLTDINVDSPGAVVAGNTVAINTSATTRSVSSVSASQVIVGGPGFGSVTDDDRIAIASPLPTIYNDAVGTETKTNPLLTDINGVAECWIIGGMYDLLVSKSGVLTTTLYTDVATVGGESMRSSIFSGTAWKLDSLRALTASDILLDLSTAGTNKFKVMGDGEIIAGAAGATHSLTGSLSTSAGLTVSSGGAAVTGNSSIVGTLTGLTGLSTSGILDASGDFDFKRFYADNGTEIAIGNFGSLTGWGTSPSVSAAAGKDGAGAFSILSGTGSPGAGPTVQFTFADGAWANANYNIFLTRGDQETEAGYWIYTTAFTTSVVFKFVGTPGVSKTYTCRFLIIGDR